MRARFTKSTIVLLIIFAGFGKTSFSQCVSEENVYSFTYLDKEYEVVKELKNWAEAAACAVERGGYLVEIESQEEQDTIYGAIVHGANIAADYTTVADGGGIAYVWIGASDGHTEGTWLWDGDGDNLGTTFWNGQGAAGQNDGSPAADLYNNWGGSSSGDPNEPDDFGAGQDGAAMGMAKWPAGIDVTLGIASEWNDISSDNNLYFVIEHDCQETSDNLDTTACGSYISPSGKIWTSSDTYVDTITNKAGCDSVITINLTITTIDTSVDLDGITFTANAAGVQYQWLDCEDGYSIIEGEMDQSYTATNNGSFAVQVTDGVCVDTSACYAATTVALEEPSLKDNVMVYQISNSNIFHINLGDSYQEVSIEVTDINGRTVSGKTFVQTRSLIFEIDQPPGIYFLILTSQKQQTVVKLIKNH